MCFDFTVRNENVILTRKELVLWCDAFVLIVLSDEPWQNQGRGLIDRKLFKRPVILLQAVPRRLFCFGSLVILDVVCRYLSLFLSYINIKTGKNRC